MAVRFITIFLTFFYPFISFCQTYSSVVPDQEIHRFFYTLNKSKTIRIHKLSPRVFPWTSIPTSADTASTDFPYNIIGKTSKEYLIFESSFSQQDIQYLKQQYDSIKDTTWNFKQLKDFVIADSLVNKEIIRKSQSGKRKVKDNHSYTFSLPLFSIDKKTVIIYQDFFCGFLCSTACVYLYQKNEKGRWRQITKWNCLSS